MKVQQYSIDWLVQVLVYTIIWIDLKRKQVISYHIYLNYINDISCWELNIQHAGRGHLSCGLFILYITGY